MSMRLSHAFSTVLCVAALTLGGTLVAAAGQAGGPAPKNPSPNDPKSIASGKKLYTTYCADCHGTAGKGDGMEGEGMDPAPSNFTDAEQEHGMTDADLFLVVRDGTKAGMRAFGKKLTPAQIWDLVNYVETFKTSRP